MTFVREQFVPVAPNQAEAAVVYEGKVIRPPASASDLVGVIVGSFADEFVDERWEFECFWESHGNEWPEEGDRVLVAVSDERDDWIVAWRPITPMVEVAIVPILTADWVTFDAATFGPPTYKKSLDGIVDLQGKIKAVNPITPPNNILTLPPDYRPTRSLSFPVMLQDGSTYGMGRLDLTPAGVLSYVAAFAGLTNSITTDTSISLSGIAYRTVD